VQFSPNVDTKLPLKIALKSVFLYMFYMYVNYLNVFYRQAIQQEEIDTDPDSDVIDIIGQTVEK